MRALFPRNSPPGRAGYNRTRASSVFIDMIKFRYFPVAGMLLAASLTIAACDSANQAQTAHARGTAPASTPTVSATPTVSPSTPAASPTASASADAVSAASSDSPSASPQSHSAFLAARAAWKQAASTSEAEMNIYFKRAADDLRASRDSSYSAAISELVYLINTPLTDVPHARQVKAEADVRALDSFFGTPGLIQ
jgi:hypothetical protein